VGHAPDTSTLADRFPESLAEPNGHVLDGVVIVNVEVSTSFDFQVEQSVAGQRIQHVIEKPNASGHFRVPMSI
jgi:hypothetical protein